MIATPDIHSLIDKEEFTHYSQGLFSTNNLNKIGVEILLRSEIGSPESIFQEAKTANRLYELETKSIIKVLNTYRSQAFNLNDHLFINIYPSTILQPEFPSFIQQLLSEFPTTRQHIIFEVIETEQVNDVPLLKDRIDLLKRLGYLIAIDDVGKGWSSLSMIIELEPHFIKLDHYFSRALSTSPLKQEMIKSLVNYTQYSNAEIVLEGVETKEDFDIAKLLGIHICQGFLLEIPQPIFI